LTACSLSIEFTYSLSGRDGSKGANTLQQSREQSFINGDLGHLENGSPRVRHDLGPYLDQLELYASQRPVRNLFRQGEPANEVAQVVGKYEQGQANLVGGKYCAR